MSAQGATLRRGTAHLPMWPLAVLAAGAAAIVLAISLSNVRPETPVQTVTDAERFANSSAAVREQGAAIPEISPIPVTSNPGQWTYSQAKAYVDSLVTYRVGLENPSVGISQVTEMTSPVGGDGSFTPTMGARPGMTGGEICGQCR
jgi:hypothetical protein